MPYFGNSSESKLITCDNRLAQICRTIIQYYDFMIIYGYRDENEQNDCYGKGLSTKKFPNSKHNVSPSLAIDIAPYPINWKDTDRFIHLAGMMLIIGYLLGYKIRWGGDWDMDDDLHDQTFMDYGHFELIS